MANRRKKEEKKSSRLVGDILKGCFFLALCAVTLAVCGGFWGQETVFAQAADALGTWSFALPVFLGLVSLHFFQRDHHTAQEDDGILDMEQVRQRVDRRKEEEKKREVFRRPVKREESPEAVRPQAEPAPRQKKAPSLRDYYGNKELKDFSSGVKPKSIFRSIFGQKAPVKTEQPAKEELIPDPVQPPLWLDAGGAERKVTRPNVDYSLPKVAGSEEKTPESEEKAKTEERDLVFVDHNAQAPAPEEGKEGREKAAAASKEPPGSSVIVNTYRDGDSSGPRFTYVDNDDVLTLAGSREEAPWHAVPQTYDEGPRPAVKDLLPKQQEAAEKKEEKEEAAPRPEAAPAAEPAEKVAPEEKTEAAKQAESTEKTEPSRATPGSPASPGYLLPPLELLEQPQRVDPEIYREDIRKQCLILEQTLADFRVKAKVTAVTRGPSVTRFELEPAPGVKVASVVNLADDIALRLAASGVRIEAPIPGKSAIGIEAPNIKNDSVCFREVVDCAGVKEAKSKLCIGLGKDISGKIITCDLAKMPHILVAGSTGSGKSVCINTIIAGLLYKATPAEVKLILVDPKVVELTNYNGIPHLLTPVVTEPKKAASALHWAVAEMERRYQTFADSRVREIESYNRQAEQPLPYIVIIIDELSDLMMVAKADVEAAILRLAQKARAAGIHLVIATQRPSVDVITGIVKANIPSRIAFAVSSQTDSRTILDLGGAEKLLGKGDMLYNPIGQTKPVRVQGAFVRDEELNRIVQFIIAQSIPVDYRDEVTSQPLESDAKEAAKEREESEPEESQEDELFKDAVRLVLDMGQASSSMLQRRFRIGFTRAARLVDTMEELGIVGHATGSKPREVILSRQEAEERFLQDN